MKLETVNVKRFRSIENTELDNCGDFNVIIGKNNTGKSSILLAINAFFECIKNGNVVKLNPKFSQEIDFFKRQINLPIEITLTFLLMPSDLDTLAQDIVREAPQMKNAVLGIALSLRISITVTIMAPPDSFSFVKKISLIDTTKFRFNYDNIENIIFNVSEESALELFNNLIRSKEYKKKADSLLSIKLDADDFVKLQKNDNREFKRLLTYRLNRTNSAELSNELVKIITDLIDESSSYEDLQKAINKLASSMKLVVSNLSHILLEAEKALP